MLDKLLYLNVDLNFEEMHHHHILLSWHLVITIGFQIYRKSLRRQRFSTYDKLRYAVEEWMKEQTELFYFTGIEKLRDSYQRCIDKGDEYC